MKKKIMISLLFVLLSGIVLAGGENIDPSEASNSVVGVAASVFIYVRLVIWLLLLVALIGGGISVYNKIAGGADVHDTALGFYMKGIIFLVLALLMVNGVKAYYLDSTKSTIGNGWEWARAILGGLLVITMAIGVLRVYAESSKENGGEFRSRVVNFGVITIFLLICFSLASYFHSYTIKEDKGAIQKEYQPAGIEYFAENLKIALFNAFNASNVAGAFFTAISSFAILLLFIYAVRTYGGVVVNGKKVEAWEIIKPIVLIVVIASWNNLSYLIDNGFNVLIDSFTGHINKEGMKDERLKSITELISSATGDSFWMGFLSGNAVGVTFGLVVGFFTALVNWLVDILVWLYIYVNGLSLKLLAPIALMLCFFHETREAFKTWLLTYMRFQFFSMVPYMIDYVGVAFVTNLKGSMGVGSLGMFGVDLYVLIVFVVMKIFLLFFVNGHLDKIFQGSSAGNVGGVVGGMGKAAIKATKLVTGAP